MTKKARAIAPVLPRENRRSRICRDWRVPILWLYGVGNGFLIAYRCKRITFDQVESFPMRIGDSFCLNRLRDSEGIWAPLRENGSFCATGIECASR